MEKTWRYDMNGRRFDHPTLHLPKKEYAKVVSEINDIYYSRYEGRIIVAHESFDAEHRSCLYMVEIRGFGDYNIFHKEMLGR